MTEKYMSEEEKYEMERRFIEKINKDYEEATPWRNACAVLVLISIYSLLALVFMVRH